MKTLIILIGLCCFSPIVLFAQVKDIQPKDGTVHYQKENVPCIEVHIDPETKTTKKAWKSFIKEHFDVKLKGIGFLVNKDVLSAEDVYIETLGSESINLYTEVKEDINGSQMKVFVSIGNDWISPDKHADKYRQVKGMLANFLRLYLPQYYKNKVSDVEDRIESLKKEIDQLEKGIIELNNDIEDAKNKIEALQSEVEQKEIDLEASKVKMEITLEKLKTRTQKLQKILEMLGRM